MSVEQIIADKQKALILLVRAKKTYDNEPIKIESCKQLGTGFFINNQGVAITSRHVIKLFEEPIEQDETLAVIYYNFSKNKYICTPISDNSFFDFREIDIAILNIHDCCSESWLEFSNKKAQLGEAIFTIGYPVNSENYLTIENIQSGLRYCCSSVCSIKNQDFICNKGLIEIRNKYLIETDRYMTGGLSGSPAMRSNDGKVIGVIAGNKLSVEDTIYTAVFDPDTEKEQLKAFPFIVPTSYIISADEILSFIKKHNNIKV